MWRYRCARSLRSTSVPGGEIPRHGVEQCEDEGRADEQTHQHDEGPLANVTQRSPREEIDGEDEGGPEGNRPRRRSGDERSDGPARCGRHTGWRATGLSDGGEFGALLFPTMAGMFTNPSYGGNANKVGWALMGFTDQFSWKPPFGYYDRA